MVNPSSIPAPRRYLLHYETAAGEYKTYEISLPIEKHDNRFTAYAFGGGGVKSFLYAGVKSLREILDEELAVVEERPPEPAEVKGNLAKMVGC